MSKIIQLDKNLANQISAWEVVERPLSVVKELIENSIDAESTNIKIELFNGWIDKIIITDNGVWIEKDDLKLVVEKYSTSKIKSLEDLHKVLTFGFRWEAMASISSVSNMQIISKSESEVSWNSLQIISGEQQKVEKSPLETGTKIIVEHLFYNTPARLNYLKKPKTEYNHIYKYIQEIAISYPKIGFELYNEGKEVFKYRENEDIKTRIYNVFWEEFVGQLLGLEFQMSAMNISWFISDPKVSFRNRNRQLIFINKRPIKSPLITKAINDAYNRFIPHNNFPAYILNLEIDPTQVDVNVHPRKMEVRFAGEQQIFRIFYHSIEQKLNSVSLINNQTSSFLSHSSGSENQYIKNNSGQDRQYHTSSGTKFKSYSPYTDTSPHPNQSKISDSIEFTKEFLDDSSRQTETTIDNFEKTTDIRDTKLWRILWQVHNSYIVVETQNGIQILDQHALAERIIYEKLIQQDTKSSTQGLLLAENIKLNSVEKDLLQENIQIFTDIWFDIEIFPENVIMINSIPDFIKKENIAQVFLWILWDMQDGNLQSFTSLEEIKNKIYAYTACRSAIKFGNKLSIFEINKLLNDAMIDYSATCPHGRPVVYEINLEDLKNKYER